MNNPNQKRGEGLVNPNQPKKPKKDKHIDIKQDGLMEREDKKVLTKDGRQLL